MYIGTWYRRADKCPFGWRAARARLARGLSSYCCCWCSIITATAATTTRSRSTTRRLLIGQLSVRSVVSFSRDDCIMLYMYSAAAQLSSSALRSLTLPVERSLSRVPCPVRLYTIIRPETPRERERERAECTIILLTYTRAAAAALTTAHAINTLALGLISLRVVYLYYFCSRIWRRLREYSLTHTHIYKYI